MCRTNTEKAVNYEEIGLTQERPYTCLFIIACLAGTALAGLGEKRPSVQVNGIFTHLTVYAEGAGSTSETGIGALIPWADDTAIRCLPRDGTNRR